MTQGEWQLWVLERRLARFFLGRTSGLVVAAFIAAAVLYFLIRGAIAVTFGP